MRTMRLTPLAALCLAATTLSLTVIAAAPTGLVSPDTVTQALNTYSAQLVETYDRAVSLPDCRVPLKGVGLNPLPSTSTMTPEQARFAEAQVGHVRDGYADNGVCIRGASVTMTTLSYTVDRQNVIVTARVNTVVRIMQPLGAMTFDSDWIDTRAITFAPASTPTGVSYSAISDQKVPSANSVVSFEFAFFAMLTLLAITLVLPLLLPFLRRNLRSVWLLLVISIGLQVAGFFLMINAPWFNEGPGREHVICMGSPLEILDSETVDILLHDEKCWVEVQRRFDLAVGILVAAYVVWLVAALGAFLRRSRGVRRSRWPLVTWWILVVLLLLGIASLFIEPLVENWGKT